MKILFSSLLIVMGAVVASGQDHCSLVVKVFDPEGKEVEKALVTVTEQSGNSQRKESEIGGTPFCNLGILPVTVTVGDAGCTQLIVRDQQLTWGKTKELKVIYDWASCNVDPPPNPVPLCRLLIRVVGANHKPVGGATIRFRSPVRTELRTDKYGRLRFVPEHGSRVEAEVEALGYKPTSFSYQCPQGESRQEQQVTLEKSR